MNRKIFLVLSACAMFVGLYLYRPSLFAPIVTAPAVSKAPVVVQRVATASAARKTTTVTTAADGSTVTTTASILPACFSGSGALSRADMQSIRQFLGMTLKGHDTNYTDGTYQCVQRLQSDPWYSGLASLVPLAPATTVTMAQINNKGISLGCANYDGVGGSFKPTNGQISTLASYFKNLVNKESVNSGDHKQILGALFTHLSESPVSDAAPVRVVAARGVVAGRSVR